MFGYLFLSNDVLYSNGAPLRIHISEPCKKALDILGGYEVEKREKISVKGKGEVQTYWLNSANDGAIKRKETISPIPPMILDSVFENQELRHRSPKLSVEMRTPRLGPSRKGSANVR